MILLKAAVLLELFVTATLASSTFADGTAQRIVVYTAAGAGLIWFWRNVLHPIARLLARTVQAVEALEELPQWRDETDVRLEDLELGSHRTQSALYAILRELGLEDKVRRMYEGDHALREKRADDTES